MSFTADVVIPTFNDQGTLRRALSSALAAGFVQRVLVVDDGSESPVSIDEPRVEVIRQENAGPSAARNTGLDQADADWTVLLDADDELLPAYIEAVRAAGDAVAVQTALEEHAGNRIQLKEPPQDWADRPLPSPAAVWKPLQVLGASGLALRRDVVDAGLRFRSDLTIGEDRELLRRVAAYGPVYMSSVVGVRTHVRVESVSGSASADLRARDFAAICRLYPADASDLAEQGRWITNHLSKFGKDRSVWRAHAELCKTHGWGVPLKCRLRRAFS